jgi:hypothetical protein
MEIYSKSGVGVKLIPRRVLETRWSFEKKFKPKEDVKSLLLEKRASKEKIGEKANLTVSFFVSPQISNAEPSSA